MFREGLHFILPTARRYLLKAKTFRTIFEFDTPFSCAVRRLSPLSEHLK